ncbi:hypothetical protein [Streptomyces sp. NPDC048481]|uniref:hypothetical protein n=1 Tax=Streptomyces sp. NPDC048481 TaxID=3365557 RepID=UPI003719961F
MRNVERATADDLDTPVPGIRSGSAADLPSIIRLYNTAHAQRPWTHRRPAIWNRPIPQTTWAPGSQTLVLQAGTAAVGYAVLEGRAFGDLLGSLIVDELVAEDAAATRLLLTAVARLCRQRRLSEFTVREPTDGLTGQVARHMGCTHQQRFPPSGGMMATVLNRSSLVRKLEPELRRRAAVQQPDHEYNEPFDALRRGDLLPDDQALIRLLLGYWSANDTVVHGISIPERYRDLSAAWFPGGGAHSLLSPYAHRLDRY